MTTLTRRQLLKPLAALGPLTLDVMVNHISRHSVEFADYVRHGRESAHYDLFMRPDKVWPEGGVPEADVLIHNETNKTLAHLLSEMQHPAFPMAMGVIYREQGKPSFDKAYWAHHATQGKRTGKVAGALRRGYVWTKKAG